METATSHRAPSPGLAAARMAAGAARRVAARLAVLAAVGLACAPAMPALAAPPGLQVAVQGASLRAPKPGFSAAVVALQLQADRDALLLGASSSAAGAVVLQRTVRQGTEVRMEPAERLPLPAGTPVRLQLGEGQFQLMAKGLKPRALQAGHILLRLQVEDAASHVQRSITVRVPVVARPGAGDAAEEHLH